MATNDVKGCQYQFWDNFGPGNICGEPAFLTMEDVIVCKDHARFLLAQREIMAAEKELKKKGKW